MKNTLQKKILAYIILIGVIPMIFAGSLYYHNAAENSAERLNNDSRNILERIERRITEQTSSLQNAADILFNDSDFQKMLREADSNATSADLKIEDSLEKMFRVERKLETIVLFSAGGGLHISGKSLGDISPARFITEYGRVSEQAGVISWQGIKSGFPNTAEERKIVAGTMLRDNAYLKDQEYLASIYLVFSNDLFSGEVDALAEFAPDSEDTADKTPAPEYMPDEMIYVYKGGGAEMLYSVGAENIGNLLSLIPMNKAEEIYSSEEGRIEFILGGVHYTAFFYTSVPTGYKYIRVVPAKLYDDMFNYIAYGIILCLIGIFILWCAINYLIVRKITLPMREIARAMKEVEDSENLDVRLKVTSKDEFGLIGRQFNKMLDTIKNLLNSVRTEEQKRKDSDILMLQYQMNPHFLYNTLAAIRMEAIMNKQHNIDKMLLILGRFLRNTIVQGTDLVSVETEIKNIEDYLSLMQLRYRNQIKVSIEVDEAAKNMRIPGMLIQPIIENAIMHGLNESFDCEKSAELKIKFEKTLDNF
ncbi:MAG: histidine kinase, partial [Clostridia bacterium]|nr:histidine kinase [Clostridia bacterium]